MIAEGDERKFGRYRIVGQRADDSVAIDDSKRVVVIKYVPAQLSSSPEFPKMFEREARIAARIDHPSVVKVFEMGNLDGQYFMSMEHLEAEHLSSVFEAVKQRGQDVPVAVAAVTAQRIAGALRCLHDLSDSDGRPFGLVHRDICLDSIFLTYQGNVKLTDFGMMKAARARVFKRQSAYASPEQVLGKSVDPRTDVFALGVVLWEMLTLRSLFKRSDESATIRAVSRTDVPSVRSFRPDVPESIEAIALKALARNPKNRFQSAAEMSDALEKVLDSIGVRSASTLLRTWMIDLFGSERAQKASFEQPPTGDIGDLGNAEGAVGAVDSEAATADVSEPPRSRSLWDLAVSAFRRKPPR